MLSHLRKATVATGLFGYVLGYSSVYFFHFVALLWIMLAVSRLSIFLPRKDLLYPFGGLVVYTLLSAAWHPDILVWARYHLYLVCGLIVMLAVFQSVNGRAELDSIFRLISSIVLLNLFIGFIESLGIMRLPMSPYSPYVNYFGHSVDVARLGSEYAETVSSRPTGFNWNPNNFGFVLMLALPFFLFHRNKLVVFGGLAVAGWLLLAIGSKGHFVALVAAVVILPFYFRSVLKRGAFTYIGLIAISLFLYGSAFIDTEHAGVARMLSAYDEAERGIGLILNSAEEGRDSTSVRAAIYSFGIGELVSTYGLGLGFGGIEAKLIEEGFAITTFHAFFLQLLIDLGIFVFLALLIAYSMLAVRLRSIALSNNDASVAYYARSSSAALLIAVPASISPSGVHYLLAFYVLLGFSLAIVKAASIEHWAKQCVDADGGGGGDAGGEGKRSRMGSVGT